MGGAAKDEPLLVIDDMPVPSTTSLRQAQGSTELSAVERHTIELFERHSPSVVYITSLAVGQDPFTLNVHEIPRGTGTGFVWDARGHMVTNFHVIQEANAARVTLAPRSASSWRPTLSSATSVSKGPGRLGAAWERGGPRGHPPDVARRARSDAARGCDRFGGRDSGTQCRRPDSRTGAEAAGRDPPR